MFKKYSHENWGLRPVVVLDLEVGEEDDGGVGGEEDEDVPGAVQVGEAHTRPPVLNVQSGYWQDQHHDAVTKVKSSHHVSPCWLYYSLPGTKDSIVDPASDGHAPLDKSQIFRHVYKMFINGTLSPL